MLQNSQENTYARPSLAILLKETSIQMFSCEISKIFKNTFFDRTPSVAASASRDATSAYKISC